MKSRSQKGELSRTYHSGQYRSQQESSRKWHYCTLLPPAEGRGEKSSPCLATAQPTTHCPNAASEKPPYLELSASSNGLFINNSPSWLLFSSINKFSSGFSWWSSGQDSVLPKQGVWVPFLDRELRSHTLNGMTKKVNEIWKTFKSFLFLLYQTCRWLAPVANPKLQFFPAPVSSCFAGKNNWLLLF